MGAAHELLPYIVELVVGERSHLHHLRDRTEGSLTASSEVADDVIRPVRRNDNSEAAPQAKLSQILQVPFHVRTWHQPVYR